jgi:hypothetical protein
MVRSVRRRTRRNGWASPLDEDIDAPAQGAGLLGDTVQDRLAAEAGVGPQQQGRSTQALRQRQHMLEVVGGFEGRVLGARAQGELEAVALGAEVGGQRTEAIDAGVGASYALPGGVAVVHGEGVDVDRAVASGEQAEVDGPTLQAQPEQALVDLVDQREPGATLGIEALAKRGARGRLRQAQRAQCEGAGSQRLDGLEVALALAQQPQVASYDVAVGDAGAHREGRVDQGIEVDALQILPDERQTGA